MGARRQDRLSITRQSTFAGLAASALACLLIALSAAEADAKRAEQTGGTSAGVQQIKAPAQGMVIEVNGRALAGPFSSPQQRGAHLFLPFTSIAKAFGDSVAADPKSGDVELQRQTGESVKLDLGLRQVRENGSSVLTFSEEYALELPPRVEELMLPVELASAMLGASIHVDSSAGVVRVTRGTKADAALASQTPSRRGGFEIYNLDYEYALNSYGQYRSYGLTLRSTGRLGGGRYSLVTNSASGGGSGGFGPLRGGTFTFEGAGGRRFVAGDLGIGPDLEFFSTSLRGGLAQLNVGGARLTAFAGRVASGSQPFSALLDTEAQAAQKAGRTKGLGFDTTVFGAYATFGATGKQVGAGGSWLFSAGAMHFGGKRDGDVLSAGSSYSTARGRLQGDVAFGRFKGFGQSGESVEGAAAAADVSGSYEVSGGLSVQGRYAYTGKNFLGPQAGLFPPARQATLGVNWRPSEWFSASVSGGLIKRLDTPGPAERNLVATVSLNPGGSLPSLFVSHTRISTAKIPNGSYTALSASKEFSRLRAFFNAARVQTLGPAVTSLQGGADVRLGEGRLLVTQSFGSRGAKGGTAEWQSAGLFRGRVGLVGGLGYSRSDGPQLVLTQKASASVQLPRQTTLQLTYSHSHAGTQFQISLRGSIIRRPEAALMASVPVAEMKRYGSVYGRVYQDTNLNGRYDPGTDQPQANVRVRLDGNLYAVSDASGLFRIDEVLAGDHQAYIDLLTVRADLTMLDGGRQQVTLQTGQDAVVDFKLERTGRASGTVWLDQNGNGVMDEGEQPLADVRVVSGSGRDTLTDENGAFTLGDLPPGQHVLLIDEKTLPDGTKSRAGSITVYVNGGKETAGANLPVIPVPPVVKRFD